MRAYLPIFVLLASSLPACGDDEPKPNPTSDVPADSAADAPDASDTAEPPGPPPLAVVLLPGEVRAGVTSDEQELLTGLKADGLVGDIKMYNAHAAFVLEGLRRTSGYRVYGGHVADAALLNEDGAARTDLYGELFLSWNLDAFDPQTVEVLSDGQDGQTAHVRFTGTTRTFDLAHSLLGTLFVLDSPTLDIVYDYRLGPDDTALSLTVTLTNTGGKTLNVELPAAMANHGDGAFPFVPGPGLDEDESMGRKVPFFAAVGRETGYGWVAEPEDLVNVFTYSGVSIVLRDAFTLAPGESVERRSWFVLSDNGSSGLQDQYRALLHPDEPTQRVQGTVALPSTAQLETSYVAAFDQLGPVAIGPIREDGSFDLAVPAGDLSVRAWSKFHNPAAPMDVIVAAGQTATTALSIDEAATVEVTTRDQDSGDPLPARVTLLREGDTPSPNPPGAARLWDTWGGEVGGIAYSPAGTGSALLPAGQYRAVATYGPSYEMDEQSVTVAAGGTAAVELDLRRVVDTSGWVSADFHIHAVMSPDSQVPYEIRALQAATDDLDLPLITEHVTVGWLGPVIAALGLSELVLAIPAQEVTTFSYGHFNAFPLAYDAKAPNFGGVYPHDKEPAELFAAIRAQHEGEVVIQVNHPRSGGAAPGAYFSYAGLDPDTLDVIHPEGWSTDWDAIEVFNGSCSRGSDNGVSLEDWFGFTNHGLRKALSSGSDTHGEGSPPGVPRNWMRLDLDALRADSEALVEVVRARRMFVSCGPFVRFEATDGTELGGMTGVDSGGAAHFTVRVEAPSWMTIEEVRLLENGVAVDVIDVSAPADPVVRLDAQLDATPGADAWYAVEVVGAGSLWPFSSRGGPYALTNPIEVDADGDGSWTPPALQ